MKKNSTNRLIRPLTGLLILMALCSIPGLAATCSFVTTLDQITSCTLGPGDIITFSNFQSSLPLSTVYAISINASGNPGSVGFNFTPVNGSAVGYSIAYSATCSAACMINGISDSASGIPAGSGIYNFSAGPNFSGNTTTVYNTSFAGTNSVTHTGTFVSGGSSQGITLDVNFGPVIATPEPTGFVLLGGAFLALGFVARGRKRNWPVK